MCDNEKILYASAKPTGDLFALFEHAEALDVDGLGKAEILERAEHYLVENKEKISFTSLSKIRNSEFKFTGSLPSSFKVRINDPELDADANDVLKDAYRIKRLMTPFKLRIILSAYIDHLKNTAAGVDAASEEKAKNIDSLRVKAISLLMRADEEKLVSVIKGLEDDKGWQ